VAYFFNPKSFTIVSGTECPRIVPGRHIGDHTCPEDIGKVTWFKCPAYPGESYGIGKTDVLVMITICEDEDVTSFSIRRKVGNILPSLNCLVRGV
jgi:hypothetical protein